MTLEMLTISQFHFVCCSNACKLYIQLYANTRNYIIFGHLSIKHNAYACVMIISVVDRAKFQIHGILQQ